MLEQVTKLIDLGATIVALISFVWLASQVLAMVREWLPEFHKAVAQQAMAVADLARTSKATQETGEATLMALQALASETDRQGAAISQLEIVNTEILRGVKALLSERLKG